MERTDVPEDARDLLLTLPPPATSLIEGTVLDNKGRPLASFEAVLHTNRPEQRVRPFAPGRFRLEAVPWGTQSLWIWADGFLHHWQPITVGPKGLSVPIEIVLDRGLTIRGIPPRSVRSYLLHPTVRFGRCLDPSKAVALEQPAEVRCPPPEPVIVRDLQVVRAGVLSRYVDPERTWPPTAYQVKIVREDGAVFHESFELAARVFSSSFTKQGPPPALPLPPGNYSVGLTVNEALIIKELRLPVVWSTVKIEVGQESRLELQPPR